MGGLWGPSSSTGAPWAGAAWSWLELPAVSSGVGTQWWRWQHPSVFSSAVLWLCWSNPLQTFVYSLVKIPITNLSACVIGPIWSALLPPDSVPKTANYAKTQGALFNSFLLIESCRGRLEKEGYSGSELKRQIESERYLFIIKRNPQSCLDSKDCCDAAWGGVLFQSGGLGLGYSWRVSWRLSKQDLMKIQGLRCLCIIISAKYVKGLTVHSLYK